MTSKPSFTVAAWLFTLCFMLLVMVVLGGTTRLTGSGLSIMEWAPLSGAFPPSTELAWQRLFTLYRTIPQYALLHPDMTLPGFRHIFWLEWAHRLWGRLMGAVFLVPLIWFAVTRQIDRPLLLRLALLFVLGGLQGAVGWFMVASGFMAGSTSVSAYRLVMHLCLALTLYAALFWTALSIAIPYAPQTASGIVLKRLATGLAVCVFLTILAGGFVAGLHAGLAYDSFPLMDGRLIPAGYAAPGLPRAWFEDVATVQFDHRALATLTALLALIIVTLGLRDGPRHARPFLLALGLVIATQYGIGIAVLLHHVPVPLAALHQACAVAALTASLALVHALRGAGCLHRQSRQDAHRAAPALEIRA